MYWGDWEDVRREEKEGNDREAGEDCLDRDKVRGVRVFSGAFGRQSRGIGERDCVQIELNWIKRDKNRGTKTVDKTTVHLKVVIVIEL